MPQRSITRRNALVVAAAAAAGTLAATARVARADEVQQLTSAEVLDSSTLTMPRCMLGKPRTLLCASRGTLVSSQLC